MPGTPRRNIRPDDCAEVIALIRENGTTPCIADLVLFPDVKGREATELDRVVMLETIITCDAHVVVMDNGASESRPGRSLGRTQGPSALIQGEGVRLSVQGRHASVARSWGAYGCV